MVVIEEHEESVWVRIRTPGSDFDQVRSCVHRCRLQPLLLAAASRGPLCAAAEGGRGRLRVTLLSCPRALCSALLSALTPSLVHGAAAAHSRS